MNSLSNIGSRLCTLILCVSLPWALSGCARNFVTGSLHQEDFISSERVAQIDAQTDLAFRPDMSKAERDSYVTEKMFVIDRQYTFYERNLTRDDNFTVFFGSIATIGMSAAATVIPLGPTTKILNSTITAVQGTEKAINQDLLLSLAIQSIQRQMRTDRANQAKIIWDRLHNCLPSQYPIYVAMSDLEAYRRAGTLESAVETLAKTTSAVETAATNNKNGTPANSVAKLNATEAVAGQLTTGVGITPSPETSVCPL